MGTVSLFLHLRQGNFDNGEIILSPYSPAIRSMILTSYNAASDQVSFLVDDNQIF